SLSALTLVSPVGAEGTNFTLQLSASASEGGAGAVATTALAINVTDVAEAPSFAGGTVFSGSDEGPITLSGIAVASNDGDDTLGAATISGIAAGWSVVDGNSGVTLSNGATFAASDLGALVVTAPDVAAAASDSLTLTVTSHEGSSTATGTQVVAVTASPVAEVPVFGRPTITFGGGNDPDDRATLSLPVSKFDGDDTLGTIATISGIPSGWTVGTIVGSSGHPSGTAAQSGLGSLVVVRSDDSFTHVATLTVTVNSSEGSGTTSASESISVTLGLSEDPAGVAGSPINLALPDPAGSGTIAVAIAGVPAGWSLNAGTNLGDGSWSVETSNPSALAITPSGDFVGAVVLPVSESWVGPDGSQASAFVEDNVEAYAPGNPVFALSGADTLTGSGAGDLFVFARPIGRDRIYDFNPASSRIDLIGFSGISSFADLQSRMANDANGNAVLTLGSGETITIEGVAVASLGSANFVFNREPTTRNAGSMTIGNGATLPLGGNIDNTGTIALNSTGAGTELVVLSDGVTLEGGGRVALSDNAANAIVDSGVGTTLTNRDNTITGAGRIGDAAMTLRNAGVIDATGVDPLVLDTGNNRISNSGVIEAAGPGGLVIGSAIVNSGTLRADADTLSVEGAATGSGVATIAGTATLEFAGASAENTDFADGAAGLLKLDRSAAFTGAISGFAGGDATDLTDLAFESQTALSYTGNGAGGGTLTVDNGTQTIDLALLGQYAAAGFQAHRDPGGGTLITYSPQTSAAEAISLTNLGH
ncbi:MAG: beta strand repeat-containing protein, partial [Alphaproteobacteria bacterium]